MGEEGGLEWREVFGCCSYKGRGEVLEGSGGSSYKGTGGGRGGRGREISRVEVGGIQMREVEGGGGGQCDRGRLGSRRERNLRAGVTRSWSRPELGASVRGVGEASGRLAGRAVVAAVAALGCAVTAGVKDLTDGPGCGGQGVGLRSAGRVCCWLVVGFRRGRGGKGREGVR